MDIVSPRLAESSELAIPSLMESADVDGTRQVDDPSAVDVTTIEDVEVAPTHYCGLYVPGHGHGIFSSYSLCETFEALATGPPSVLEIFTEKDRHEASDQFMEKYAPGGVTPT
eukprot:1409073-Prymnesium_polylepis.1